MCLILNIERNFYSCSIKEILTLNAQISSLEHLYKYYEIHIEKYADMDIELIIDEEFSKPSLDLIYTDDQNAIIQSIYSSKTTFYESRDILSHYMIVATFSLYEKRLKKLFEIVNYFLKMNISVDEIKNCTKRKNANNVIKKHFDIEYDKFNEYNLVENELRYLNNSIKHTGIVSKELAEANSKWVSGKELATNLYEDFVRLKDAPNNLLYNLIHALNLFKSE